MDMQHKEVTMQATVQATVQAAVEERVMAHVADIEATASKVVAEAEARSNWSACEKLRVVVVLNIRLRFFESKRRRCVCVSHLFVISCTTLGEATVATGGQEAAAAGAGTVQV